MDCKFILTEMNDFQKNTLLGIIKVLNNIYLCLLIKIIKYNNMTWIWIILALILLAPAFVLGYILMATLLKWIPTNRKARPNAEGTTMWVVSNGAHSDLILPIKTLDIDWTEFIDTSLFKNINYQYISFGWGDKGFYLDTPSWGELQPKVAFKALFYLGETAMQVVLHEDIPSDAKYKKAVKLNADQYHNIIQYVKRSFRYDSHKQPMPIEFAGLPAYEHLNYQFYEATGRYHFFKTCNCWVNDALKLAEVRTATWAPFSKAIFHQLNKFLPEESVELVLQPVTLSRRRRILNRLKRF